MINFDNKKEDQRNNLNSRATKRPFSELDGDLDKQEEESHKHIKKD